MELLSILVYVTVLPVAGDTVLGHLLEADTLWCERDQKDADVFDELRASSRSSEVFCGSERVLLQAPLNKMNGATIFKWVDTALDTVTAME